MKSVTIGFSNFWGGSDSLIMVDYFYRCFPFLRDHYDFKLSNNPDVMFYSVYGYIRNLAPESVRVLMSMENGDPFFLGAKMAPEMYDTGFFHYGLTSAFDSPHPNHCYLFPPLVNLNLYNDGYRSLLRDGSPAPEKKFFCDFIYSNPYSQLRRDFCRQLGKYKRVECPGPVDRNTTVHFTGYNKETFLFKQAFQSECKFSIAFENTYYSPGYTTEKLTDPLVARSVPIYSGNPKVSELFNPKSFINVDSFTSWDKAIEYIEYVDEADDVYDAYLNEPPFVNNRVPDRICDDVYLNFFRRIFGD
jgi:alpha(1,3/1,4) fucosyltransferase